MRRHTWEFYYHNSGRAYRPGAESEFAAAAVAAAETARAVQWVWESGMFFVWATDEDGAECQNEDGTWERYPAVFCSLVRENEVNTEVMESLSGITESDDADVARDYRDVVEGELALQAFHARQEI